jgi:hypothetical protein
MHLSFTIAAGRSHSHVRVPRDSRPQFTVSDSRLHQPGGPGPVFISPRNMVAQLYTQALGSLFVGSYDSQGYDRGIRTRLHCRLSTNCSAYNVPAHTAQKTPCLCCCFKLLPCKRAYLQSRYSVTAVV